MLDDAVGRFLTDRPAILRPKGTRIGEHLPSGVPANEGALVLRHGRGARGRKGPAPSRAVLRTLLSGVNAAGKSPTTGVGKSSFAPGGGAPGGGIPDNIRVRYRDQVFVVPEEWYVDYYLDLQEVFRTDDATSYGLVGSVDETLSALWGPFEGDATRDASAFASLLGCYNLHRDDWEWSYVYQFWSSGWGAPYQVFLRAMQVLHTYATDAETADLYPGSGTPFYACAGFVPFVEAMLEGREARRSVLSTPVSSDSGVESCSVRINYRNADPREPVNEACWTAEPTCTLYDPLADEPCIGPVWSDWEPSWVESEDCYTGNGSTTGCGAPAVECGGAAIGGDWNVTFHAIHLSYYGFVCDRILFRARMAFDYALYLAAEGELEDAFEAALTGARMSRYALGIVVAHARVALHELGQLYLGGNHCDGDKNCCFDIASEAWRCRVRGRLGLPVQVNDTRSSGDFDNPDAWVVDACTGCGADNGTTSRNYASCDTISDGTVGMSAVAIAYPCWPPAIAARVCPEAE